MKDLLSSATKITLLLFAITICITTTYLVVKSWENAEIVMWFVAIFNMSIGLVFWFYFRNSTTNSETENKNLNSKK